jgi:hypothetical protein
VSDMMVVGYRPKFDHEDVFLELLKDHVPFLQRLGLATDRPALAMRSKGGEFIEIFEWKPGALEQAHGNPAVTAMWAQFSAVCDFVPLHDLPETRDLFAQFTPIDL